MVLTFSFPPSLSRDRPADRLFPAPRFLGIDLDLEIAAGI